MIGGIIFSIVIICYMALCIWYQEDQAFVRVLMEKYKVDKIEQKNDDIKEEPKIVEPDKSEDEKWKEVLKQIKDFIEAFGTALKVGTRGKAATKNFKACVKVDDGGNVTELVAYGGQGLLDYCVPHLKSAVEDNKENFITPTESEDTLEEDIAKIVEALEGDIAKIVVAINDARRIPKKVKGAIFKSRMAATSNSKFDF